MANYWKIINNRILILNMRDRNYNPSICMFILQLSKNIGSINQKYIFKNRKKNLSSSWTHRILILLWSFYQKNLVGCTACNCYHKICKSHDVILLKFWTEACNHIYHSHLFYTSALWTFFGSKSGHLSKRIIEEFSSFSPNFLQYLIIFQNGDG